MTNYDPTHIRDLCTRTEDEYRDQFSRLVPDFNSFNVVATRSQLIAEIAVGGRLGRCVGVSVPLDSPAARPQSEPPTSDYEAVMLELRKQLDEFLVGRAWEK